MNDAEIKHIADQARVIEFDDARLPEFSDESLALGFAQQHVDDLRYVAAWSRWFLWTGARWEPEETMRAFDLARAVCRDASTRCKNKTNSAIASAKTVAAVERLAKADRRLAATSDQWDSDPWLLNTPGGVVDLHTGKRRPHQQSDYMTKIAAVAPGGDCPLWLKFLSHVTGGDDDLVAFLQRLSGYALTGLTREHALFFLFGTGANGKTVLIGVLSGILGDYHRTAPIETFVASSIDRHPTELAMLRGARLVTAVETEEGRRWAESRIKQLTGGDPIAARFMRRDFFEYTPQFKLLIAGNHRPGLRSVDEAIRRRLNLVPFNVTIPLQERDPTLPEQLRAEWPGILQWAIEGCLEWQKHGLQPPAAVQTATASYLEGEDALATWLEEACERDPAAWTLSKVLFASYRAWAEISGEAPGTSRRFAQALESHGIVPERRHSGRGFLGLSIRQTGRSEARWNR